MKAQTYGYLVLGPESSGTRATAALLEAAGCRRTAIIGDDDGPELPLDGHPPLIRRSAPHGERREWPDVAQLAELLEVQEVQAIVTIRDWFAMAKSQAHRKHVPSLEDAHRNIRHAYKVIFAGLAAENVPFVLSSYESLVSRRGYSEQLLSFLGLPSTKIETFDGNAKWYGRGEAGDETDATAD